LEDFDCRFAAKARADEFLASGGDVPLVFRHDLLELLDDDGERQSGLVDRAYDTFWLAFTAARGDRGNALEHGFPVEQDEACAPDEQENYDECEDCDSHALL